MDKTIDLIFSCSNLPLSIIIVGIGNADFTNMVRLDGDNGLYNSNGEKAKRDIVQFVPFREVQLNPDLLAKQLLAELPDQVVQYFTNQGMPPRQPLSVQNINLLLDNEEKQEAAKELSEMFNKADFFGIKEEKTNPYG